MGKDVGEIKGSLKAVQGDLREVKRDISGVKENLGVINGKIEGMSGQSPAGTLVLQDEEAAHV